MLLSPVPGLFSLHAVCRTQGRLPIECIHHNTQADACKELSYPVCFLRGIRGVSAAFWACSSVCRELFVKFVRSSKNEFFRTSFGEKSKKGLVFLFEKWYVVSNKSETWIHLHFGAATSAPHTLLFFTLLFSSFTFLSFTLPVPQGTRKAMTHLHGSSLFLLSTTVLWAGTSLNVL